MAKRASAASVYGIFGPDALLRDQALREVLHEVLGVEEECGACSEFDADSPLAEILDELQTLPMLVSRRAVLVRNADDFIRDHREALERYCQDPSSTASLILVSVNFDKRTRLYRIIGGKGVLRPCETPRGQALIGWIVHRAGGEYAKTIDRQAASRLQRLIGEDLQAIDSELLKLATYVGDRTVIRREDVDCLVGLRREEKVFAIADAIIRGDAAHGLATWDQVWATDRAAPVRGIGGLAWALRRYLDARHQLEAGESLASVAQQFWTTAPELAARLGKRSLADFEGHLCALQTADAGVKAGVHDARSAVEKLIVSRSATPKCADV